MINSKGQCDFLSIVLFNKENLKLLGDSMKGHWKDKLKYRIRDNGKAIINTFDNYRKTPPKLKGREMPCSFDSEGSMSMMYGKPFNSCMYSRIGLDGSSGSKHRAFVSRELKKQENQEVRRYIHNADWDADVLDYRGMKTTVTWDIH